MKATLKKCSWCRVDGHTIDVCNQVSHARLQHEMYKQARLDKSMHAFMAANKMYEQKNQRQQRQQFVPTATSAAAAAATTFDTSPFNAHDNSKPGVLDTVAGRMGVVLPPASLATHASSSVRSVSSDVPAVLQNGPHLQPHWGVSGGASAPAGNRGNYGGQVGGVGDDRTSSSHSNVNTSDTATDTQPSMLPAGVGSALVVTGAAAAPITASATNSSVVALPDTAAASATLALANIEQYNQTIRLNQLQIEKNKTILLQNEKTLALAAVNTALVMSSVVDESLVNAAEAMTTVTLAELSNNHVSTVTQAPLNEHAAVDITFAAAAAAAVAAAAAAAAADAAADADAANASANAAAAENAATTAEALAVGMHTGTPTLATPPNVHVAPELPHLQNEWHDTTPSTPSSVSVRTSQVPVENHAEGRSTIESTNHGLPKDQNRRTLVAVPTALRFKASWKVPASLPTQLELPGRNWCQIAGQRRVHTDAVKGMPVCWPANVKDIRQTLPSRECSSDSVGEINGKKVIVPAPTLSELCDVLSKNQATPYHPRSAFRVLPRLDVDDVVQGDNADADDEEACANVGIARASTLPPSLPSHESSNAPSSTSAVSTCMVASLPSAHGPAMPETNELQVLSWIMCRGCRKWNQAVPGTVDETNLKGQCPASCAQCLGANAVATGDGGADGLALQAERLQKQNRQKRNRKRRKIRNSLNSVNSSDGDSDCTPPAAAQQSNSAKSKCASCTGYTC